MPSPRDLLLFVQREAEPPKVPLLHQQERDWSCGPAALVNACAILGLDTVEEEIRKLAGTSTLNGTDEDGLLTAITALGLTPETMWTSDSGGARRRLQNALRDGWPVLLCLDRWDHWVTVSKGNDVDLVTLFDPAKDSEEQASMAELVTRWKHPDEDRPFYAIVVRH